MPWHRRTRREAGKVLSSLGIHPWGTSLCLRTLTWAGHVSRLPDSRLCKQVLRWKDLEWWRRRQALIELGFPQLRHPQGQFGYPAGGRLLRRNAPTGQPITTRAVGIGTSERRIETLGSVWCTSSLTLPFEFLKLDLGAFPAPARGTPCAPPLLLLPVRLLANF